MQLLAVRLVISMILALLTVDAHAQAGKWVKLAPFPEPAEELYGIAAGGKMYFSAGGGNTLAHIIQVGGGGGVFFVSGIVYFLTVGGGGR